MEDTADLNTLVIDYLKGLSPNAAIVDGIVRFVTPLMRTILSCFSRTYCISQELKTDCDRFPKNRLPKQKYLLYGGLGNVNDFD